MSKFEDDVVRMEYGQDGNIIIKDNITQDYVIWLENPREWVLCGINGPSLVHVKVSEVHVATNRTKAYKKISQIRYLRNK